MKNNRFKIVLLKLYFKFLRFSTIFCISLYHFFRSLKYVSSSNSLNGWQASMRVKCHILEKGLTMPNVRYGFGQARILDLINILKKSIGFINQQEYIYAVSLLKEYLNLHERNNYKLAETFKHQIEEVVSKFPNIRPCKQIKLSCHDYFDNADSSFLLFAKSRHTIRQFSGPADINDIIKAVDLANTAPSACNRQPVKSHFFSEASRVQSILKVQTGNNGFGHLIPQLFILSADVNMVGVKECNDIYTNVGIFAMNLCYSLYYYKIASCILNWSVVPKVDKELRKLTNIPKQETIVLIMAVGKPSDIVDIANSKRQSLDKYFFIH